MKSRQKEVKRIKTKTMKAQKRKKRITKSKVKTPKFLKDSYLPLDLQAGGETKEKLNDDDCRFYMLMGEVKQLRSYEDGKIRHANSSIAKILQDEFSASFIRKSLSKLNREGMVKIQIKKDSKSGKLWREITIIRNNVQSDYYANWLNRNSTKTEKPFENKTLPAGLQIDINNEEPLKDADYKFFFLLTTISDKKNGDVIKLSNSGISNKCEHYFSEKDIFQSLGKLAKEGLIQVNIYEVLDSTKWREIVIIPGFGLHKGCNNWIEGMKKKLNRKIHPEDTKKEKTNTEMVPYYLSLPTDVAWALREIEVNLSGYDDNFIDSTNLNRMSDIQYQIFGAGIKNKLSQLKLTQKEWNKLKERSIKMSAGETGAAINLFAYYHFRIHLEALRLLSGKSIMDILYLGEINVQNEISETDHELYINICDEIWSRVQKNPDLDLTQLTLENIQKEIKNCA